MIIVLKTNVCHAAAVRHLRPRLNHLLPNERWNFDLDDCDKILRIDSVTDKKDSIIELLREQGFYCEELTD